MPKKTPPPRIADLLPVASPADSKVASNNDSNARQTRLRAGELVQLNARVPVDLHAGLIEAQSSFTREYGRKPSMQELVAACLRVGLNNRGALDEAMGEDGIRSTKRSNRGRGEGPDG